MFVLAAFFTARNAENAAQTVKKHRSSGTTLDLKTVFVIKRCFQEDTMAPRFICQLMLDCFSAVEFFHLFLCKKSKKLEDADCRGEL